MKKSRLEELRKQKATVYTVFDGDKKATTLVLDENCNDNNVLAIAYFSLSNLWETKELAEWHSKTYAERTERFEPPMWDEIKDRYEFDFTNDCGDYKFNVIKNCMIEIIIHRKSNEPTYFEWLFEVDDNECTKENYEKACEIVRDLFKGESNGKNA